MYIPRRAHNLLTHIDHKEQEGRKKKKKTKRQFNSQQHITGNKKKKRKKRKKTWQGIYSNSHEAFSSLQWRWNPTSHRTHLIIVLWPDGTPRGRWHQYYIPAILPTVEIATTLRQNAIRGDLLVKLGVDIHAHGFLDDLFGSTIVYILVYNSDFSVRS